MNITMAMRKTLDVSCACVGCCLQHEWYHQCVPYNNCKAVPAWGQCGGTGGNCGSKPDYKCADAAYPKCGCADGYKCTRQVGFGWQACMPCMLDLQPVMSVV